MQTHVQDIWGPYAGCTWMEGAYQPGTSACLRGTAQAGWGWGWLVLLKVSFGELSQAVSMQEEELHC